MTLPVSGAISFNNINVELGVAGTTQASLGQSSYRTLAGVASGAISMSNFYGKSNRAAISYTFSSNTTNASLNLSSISGYVAGTSDITVTINNGVYLYATSTGSYGLSLSGATTGDTVTIVNSGGKIIGRGGDGASQDSAGTNGGPALNIASIGVSSITINNTNGSAYIAGGGGGGTSTSSGSRFGGGGGGAGGGNGSYYPSFGGGGGGPGASGSNGGTNGEEGYGGGGGRVLPGTTITGPSVSGYNAVGGYGGSGGGTGGATGGKGNAQGGNGGGGTTAGGTGSSSQLFAAGGGGGGGWGASGGQASINGTIVQGPLSAGGKAVNTGGKSITWTSGDTSRVYGSVS